MYNAYTFPKYSLCHWIPLDYITVDRIGIMVSFPDKKKEAKWEKMTYLKTHSWVLGKLDCNSNLLMTRIMLTSIFGFGGTKFHKEKDFV